jgi:pyruvate kinase
MPTDKKTKIVATLGPACSSKEVIKNMIDAGVNVFRINFSHADYEDVKERINIIRGLNDEFGYTTAILADLQGPKLRVGVMKEDVVVSKGDIITNCRRHSRNRGQSLYELQRISERCKSGRKNSFG